MMKPQAVLPAASVLLYLWFRRRDETLAGSYTCCACRIGLAAYELYFAAALFPERGLKSLLLLPVSYARIGSIQPVLTAHMPNIWYVAAMFSSRGTRTSGM
jgi:hypothetical protein